MNSKFWQTLASAVLLTMMMGTHAQAQTTHTVTVAPNDNLFFSPSAITITVGDTVHWVWGGFFHNVRSGILGQPTTAFYSGPPANPGTTFDVVFDQAFLNAHPAVNNVYPYYCEPHGFLGMTGSITVDIPVLPCDGDITPAGGNGVVNIDDLVAVLNAFGPCPPPPANCAADITPAGGNGVVNIDDLVAVLNAFGACP